MIAAVIELVDVPALISLYRAYTRRLGREFGIVARPDLIAALAALLGVTAFDTLPGLFIGIAVSLLLLVYRASRPYVATLGEVPGNEGLYSDLDRHPENEAPAHVAVLRVAGGLYFANAETVRQHVLRAAAPEEIHTVVLDAETIPFVDVSAARMLAELSEQLRRREVRLLIARDIGQVRDMLRQVIDDQALIRVYATIQAAVDAGQSG